MAEGIPVELSSLITTPGQRRRIGFLLKITDDPELQKEYKEYHKNVWPEMHAALNRAGWHNYSLFLKADGTLFGVFESDRTLQECVSAMEKEEINEKWQATMKKFVRRQKLSSSFLRLI
jgi:L-rhamnose mutarotase